MEIFWVSYAKQHCSIRLHTFKSIAFQTKNLSYITFASHSRNACERKERLSRKKKKKNEKYLLQLLLPFYIMILLNAAAALIREMAMTLSCMQICFCFFIANPCAVTPGQDPLDIFPLVSIADFVQAQRTVVPEDVRADDVNGNRQFLDADANRETRTSADDDESNNNGRDDAPRVLSPPPPHRRSRFGRNPHQQQQQARLQLWRSSTSSLDKTDRDHSSDSLDKVEFCSTADYRWANSCCYVMIFHKKNSRNYSQEGLDFRSKRT